MNRAFRCVIFDCDGTLVDSELLGHTALVSVLRRHGIEREPADLMVRYRGARLNMMLAELSAEAGVDLSPGVVDEYRAAEREMFEAQLQLVDGVAEMLRAVELPKCVASSGPLEKIQRALRLTGIDSHFGARVFSSYDVGSWKPDPGLFLYAAEQMQVEPHECVVVEDSKRGADAALSAGMNCILYDRTQSLGPQEPAKVIGHMRELSGHLKSGPWPLSRTG